MAQSAGFFAQDNRTDIGIPVYWTTANSDPPWNFKVWLDQFLMAVTVKENVNPDVMLEDPKPVLEEPEPRPETPRDGESAAATAAREARDRLLRDRVAAENEERRERGPKVGHNIYYNEVQKRLVSRLFLAFGTEGKKRFVQKNPHVEISKLQFKEMVRLAKETFEKCQSITYERYKLFNRAQEVGESLESFHAALTAQAAKSALDTLEDELVRDLFISKMRSPVLQDTLTFETLPPEEVLKRAIKFEQSKQSTQAFQKTTLGTAQATLHQGPQIKVKQEPIMVVGNRNQSNRKPYRERNRRKQQEGRGLPNNSNAEDRKPCNRCGRPFVDGHLKNCAAMGKQCKNCNKPNHFARMCRSQQVSEITENTESSEGECNLIQTFDSCEEFEVMAVEQRDSEVEMINRYIEEKMKENSGVNELETKKIDIRNDSSSGRMKSLKALIRIDNQIINMTVDTGSPISFINWTVAKQILELSEKIQFTPVEKLYLPAQFVDYNKKPIAILGAVKANIRSAGWEVPKATFLITERRTRCILGLDLQNKIGITTTQRPAPTKKSRFDIMLCEQSDQWKEKFYKDFKSLFDRKGRSVNHVVNTTFKYPLCPIQEKGRRIPIHVQGKVEKEIEKLLLEGHIQKLDKCTSDCFIAPIVITVKKDDTIKLALDAKPINRQLYKNKYQMPNVEELLDGVSQIVTAQTAGTLFFTVLDLKYAYSQLKLNPQTARQCNFNIVGGKATGTYRFLTGFYGLADMPAEFQKAMDRTLNHSKNTFCFLDDILIVSKGSEIEHEKLIIDVLSKLDKENLSLKLVKCEFFKTEVNWLGHKLSESGVTPKITKTEAILKLEHPKSLKQLRSFLGSINHLAKFIPNAANLTEKLRPLLREENEKKKLKNIKIPVKKFEWGTEHNEVFEEIKKAVANIAKLNYYDPNRDTRVKCDASHSGLGASLEQQTEKNEWIPIAFASRYLNNQEKKYSTNELELLAVVWSVDRFKHYLLGKEFVIVTDHKALTSALEGNKSNKTYQSRLTRWVDRLLPYQFKIVHIPGKDMGIVDYLSREPSGEPWPETKLDEKFVVTSIECFHRALDCLYSRLSDTDVEIPSEKILEYSQKQNREEKLLESRRGCYSNRTVKNRTKLDRNENGGDSDFLTDKNVLKQKNTRVNFNRAIQSVNLVKNRRVISEKMEDGRMKKKSVRIEDGRTQTQEENDQVAEAEITETTFHRTCRIRRTLDRTEDSFDEDSCTAQAAIWEKDAEETKNLLSIWDLVSKDQELPGNIRELEAMTQMVTSSPRGSPAKSIIEVDLTADDDDFGPEVSAVQTSRRIKEGKTQLASALTDVGDTGNFTLSKLFDKTLLAELISEDVWMDRLRRVIERKDRAGFELMGPYTNPLWNQLSVVDDCILVDNRIAVPAQLRQAVLKRIHRGHPGQEAMIDVSNYLWWPHMHKDIVNLAEECRECTRYGKNAKYIIPKNSSQPLPLLSQPGQEVQLDYAGPLEDHKGKKIYLLVAIDRFSKFPSVKVTKSTGGKSTIKFLRSYIDTHGIPESIKTDQFSGFKGKAMKKFCLEHNIEQKFCPVGDHRGCGLVERTIQTIKRRLGVMLLEENVKSIKLCLSTIIRDLRWIKQKTIQKSPFAAHFNRLPKTEFKIIRDKFVEFSDNLDKQHLERSALTASQLKKRIDQSRDSLKIVKKGQRSREVSPLFKQASLTTQERNRARTL